MKKSMTKQDIIDWIDFIYKNMLQYQVPIGGFYFTFDQLDELFNKKTQLERKINCANNKLKVTNQFISDPLLNDHLDTLEKANLIFKKSATFVAGKIKAINKYNELVELEVTYEDLAFVYDNLSFLKDELDTVVDFLLEEIQTIKDGEENTFFIFVNDMLADTKQTLKTGKVTKMVEVPAIKITVVKNA